MKNTKKKRNKIKPSFFESVAQLSHACFGAALTFGVIALLKTNYLVAILPLYTLVTGLKEFWYDQHYENRITRGSNLLDWATYQCGAYLALALYFFKTQVF